MRIMFITVHLKIHEGTNALQSLGSYSANLLFISLASKKQCTHDISDFRKWSWLWHNVRASHLNKKHMGNNAGQIKHIVYGRRGRWWWWWIICCCCVCTVSPSLEAYLYKACVHPTQKQHLWPCEVSTHSCATAWDPSLAAVDAQSIDLNNSRFTLDKSLMANLVSICPRHTLIFLSLCFCIQGVAGVHGSC